MKEEVDIVILALRKEKINRKKESFEDFINRLRDKYVKGLKTERITIQVVQRKGEKAKAR